MRTVSFIHPKWGAIKVTYTARAKRITMRGLCDAIHMTVPRIALKSDIERALAMHGDKLLQQRVEKDQSLIDTAFKIESDNMRLNVEEHDGNSFIMRNKGGVHTLLCPRGTDYPGMQEWLRKAIVNVLKREGKKILPERLKALAAANGFRYGNCSVREMHTRWGSCNQKGNISLNAYLLLLPDRLIDYVLLHELCHTVEMNHGERFWALLDKVCGCSSRKLREELRKHQTRI